MDVSNRMLMNAGLLIPGGTVADIGCDHAKLSVYLIENGIADRVIAMDVREGPLERARTTVEDAGLADRIDIRLSDGGRELKDKEADSAVIAGMGGKLALSIIEDSLKKFISCKCIVIQAQSETDILRRRMSELGFEITDEDMVYEDGKFYVSIRYEPSRDGQKLTLMQEIYGPVLIEKKHPVLIEYAKAEKRKLSVIYEELKASDNGGERIRSRLSEISESLEILKDLQNLLGF